MTTPIWDLFQCWEKDYFWYPIPDIDKVSIVDDRINTQMLITVLFMEAFRTIISFSCCFFFFNFAQRNAKIYVYGWLLIFTFKWWKTRTHFPKINIELPIIEREFDCHRMKGTKWYRHVACVVHTIIKSNE